MNNINTAQDLFSFSAALTEAVVQGRFMSVEHAKNIWLNLLRVKGFDVDKKKLDISEGKE